MSECLHWLVWIIQLHWYFEWGFHAGFQFHISVRWFVLSLEERFSLSVSLKQML